MKQVGDWLLKNDRGIFMLGLIGLLAILGTISLDIYNLDFEESSDEEKHYIIVAPANTTFRDITWKVAELVAIPITLVIIAYFINKRQQADEQKRRDNAEKITHTQTEEATLQNYFDRMTELLLDRGLRQSEPYSEVRNLARSQTLTTIRALSGKRKISILHFLRETDLIKLEPNIIDLSRADFTEADLKEATLSQLDLGRVRLSGTDLHRATLTETNLVKAELLMVDLTKANLTKADLRSALLRQATLIETNLTKANLAGADLREVNLKGANLTDAILDETKLTEAKYDHRTRWPSGFVPERAGAIMANERYV
ncbi:MAG: pentapeptide repeat-containing protein [Anaerolineae bacterium]|nr:pentapeptide repeat-containing protein [Anaerolineae bacterium]